MVFYVNYIPTVNHHRNASDSDSSYGSLVQKPSGVAVVAPDNTRHAHNHCSDIASSAHNHGSDFTAYKGGHALCPSA